MGWGPPTAVWMLESLALSDSSAAVATVVSVLVAVPGVGNSGLAGCRSVEESVRTAPMLRDAENDEEGPGCASSGIAAGCEPSWAGDDCSESMTFLRS